MYYDSLFPNVPQVWSTIVCCSTRLYIGVLLYFIVGTSLMQPHVREEQTDTSERRRRFWRNWKGDGGVEEEEEEEELFAN